LWSVSLNNKFIIELSSDLDYEGMVVIVSFGNQTIANINYEKGIDNIEVELFLYNETIEKLKFPLNDFLLVMEKAKKLAIKCAKEDEERKQSDTDET
jgi:hypothetical protein